MSHSISLSDAAAMTSLYRDERENILGEDYKNSNILPICESFSKAAFQNIINQTGCNGVRIYYGMTTDLKIHSIIVGVNANGEDMLPSDPNVTDGEIAENGNRCPDLCPPNSPLNSND